MLPHRVRAALERLEDRTTPSTFAVVGDSLIVTGTEGDDRFAFVAGATSHQVTLNGESFTVTPGVINSVYADGLGGNDSAELRAGEGFDLFVADPRGGLMVGGNYFVGLSNFPTTVAYGSPSDLAVLRDSEGDDTFLAFPEFATLYDNATFSSTAIGFGTTQAFGESGGNDYALLFDSAGDDTFTSSPGFSTLAGAGFSNSANNFESVDALAGTGVDVAYFYDSPLDDSFTSLPGYATMTAAGYGNSASGFDEVTAFFGAGGDDTAYFFGSVGRDGLFANSTETTLSGEGYRSGAVGAVVTFVDLTQGGDDFATFYDSVGDDTFVGVGNSASLSGPGFAVSATGLEAVTLFGLFGGTDTQFISPPLGYLFASDGFANG